MTDEAPVSAEEPDESGAAIPQPTTLTLDDARKYVNDAKAEMKAPDGGLIERDAEIDLFWSSLIARVHGLLISEGGQAKSMTIDMGMTRVEGTLFSMLLRKSMPVEQLVGPVSVKGLVNDQFKHIIRGRLPEANVGFGDEIFKCNAVVLNALLGILNERTFDNDGKKINVPLWAFFGASNELPIEPELAAFRDRFGWCKMVEPVKTDDGFKAILAGQVARNAGRGSSSVPPTVVPRTAMEMLQAKAREVKVGPDVLNDLAQLRRKAEGEKSISISPRRYGEGVKLMQANAVLLGRDFVASDDLTIFQHILWNDPEDRATAYELTLDFAGKVAQAAAKLRSAFEPHKSEVMQVKAAMGASGEVDQEAVAKLAPMVVNLKKVKQKVDAEISDGKSAGRDVTELEALATEVDDALRVVREEIMS